MVCIGLHWFALVNLISVECSLAVDGAASARYFGFLQWELVVVGDFLVALYLAPRIDDNLLLALDRYYLGVAVRL